MSDSVTNRAARDRRLRALGEAIAAHESEFGVITAKELAEQERADRTATRVVRGKGRTRPSRDAAAARPNNTRSR